MNKENTNQIHKKLLKWYQDNKKSLPWRKTRSLYKVLISEIFLQKTNTTSVEQVYHSFFDKYSEMRDLYQSDIQEVREDIKPLGLANQRSKTLKNLSELVIEQHDGKIPEDPSILKTVDGIGDYVSKASLCFSKNARFIFMDVNIERIMKRLYFDSSESREIKKELDILLPKEEIREFYFALLDFGSKICIKNDPKCEICPISEFCEYFEKQKSS